MAEKQTEGRVEDDLLYSARHGDAEAVKNVLVNAPDQFNINYKGKNKANFGWSALHLASYFGHTDVVNLLLKNEADVNIINNVGDTPLHRAAYTGRLDVVISLLKHNADVSLINSEGHTPKQVSKTAEIRNMMKAAENVELRKCEEEFLQTARDGCLDNLAIILRSGSLSSINCVDNFGNTALHQAAYRGQKESAILLLQNGIDPAIKNARGQTALNLARNEQMKQLLDVRPITQLQRDVQRFEGQLFKRSRILGWKPYWVVLGKGVLSLFRNRADASTGSKRKGFKYLDDAQVQVRTESPLMFGVRFSDNTSMTFCVDARSSTSLDRQKWENALAEHISYSNHYTHQGQKNISDDEMEDILPLGSMQDALQTAQAHEHVLEREVSQVTQTIESILSLRTASPVMLAQVRQQLSQIMESSREMVGSLSHSLAIFTQQDELRKIQVQQATEKSRVLQDALHILAEEHLDLERSLGAHRSSVMYDSDQEEFFDCPEVLSQGSYSSSVSTDASALNHNNCDLTSEGKGSLEGTDVHSQGDSRLANETSKWGGR